MPNHTEPETDSPNEPTEPETEPTVPATEPSTEPVTEPETVQPTLGEPELCGDVNCDGSVNILDVICLNKNLMVGDPITAQGRLNADANRSGGDPDEVDTLTILKYVVELIKELPYTG